MFNRILDDLTLSSDLAGTIFRNINCDGYNGDRSFVATLRALLHPRIGDNQILGSLTSSTYRARAIRENAVRDIIAAGIGDIRPNRIEVHNVHSRDTEDRNAFFECLDDPERGFIKAYPSFHEMTNIRDFVAPVMRARFYTSEETRTTIIIVDSLNTRKWHYIQSFTPRYFKWYFETSPITEEEKNLLASLLKRSSDDYERIIEEMASKFDMRSHLIESMIGDIEKNSRRTQLERLDGRIGEYQHRLESYMSQYRDALEALDDLNLKRIGLLDIINGASAESELVEYFKANKNLDLIGSSGSTFEFIVHTYLDYWNQEIFDTMVNKPQSSLYCGYRVRNSVFESVDARKKFFKAIFSEDPLIRVKMCGYYRLDIRGDSTSRAGYTYPRNCSDRIPNPHLQKYNCLGNHQRAINNYLRGGDTVGAVEQCVGSCKSINLAESQTFTFFFEKLFASNENVIELPDHTCVSPVEALKWLNERDEATTTEV